MTFFVNGISIIFTACLFDGIICSIGKISCLREWGAAYARLEGPAQRVAIGNGGESRNPAKRGKMPSLAFFPTSFLTKTCLFFMLPDDAPSMGLLV